MRRTTGEKKNEEEKNTKEVHTTRERGLNRLIKANIYTGMKPYGKLFFVFFNIGNKINWVSFLYGKKQVKQTAKLDENKQTARQTDARKNNTATRLTNHTTKKCRTRTRQKDESTPLTKSMHFITAARTGEPRVTGQKRAERNREKGH